jgi:hypothetical protein
MLASLKDSLQEIESATGARLEFYRRREDGTYEYIEFKNEGSSNCPLWAHDSGQSSRFESIEIAIHEAEKHHFESPLEMRVSVHCRDRGNFAVVGRSDWV